MSATPPPMLETPLVTDTPIVFDARSRGNVVLASVKGEVDLHNSPEMRQALLEVLLKNMPHKLILNLQQVPYMDSSAVAVLVEGMRLLHKSGGKIYLTHLQPRVRGLLEIARLDSIFGLVDDEADALSRD